MKKRKHDDASLSCSLIRRPIQRWGWLFLLPTFAAFCVGFLYPFAKGLFLSFCKFKTTSKWTWVGLKNYQTIFQDDGFLHRAFWYTGAVRARVAAHHQCAGIRRRLCPDEGHQGLEYLPDGLLYAEPDRRHRLGYIWLMIFDGILSHFDTAVVLETKYGFWGLIILMCWQQIGYMMIIYIAGLQAIPEDMLEAAKIDGASGWKTLWHITIPNVMPSITICTFLSLTNGFKLYDQNLALTGGSPFKTLADGSVIKTTEMLALNIVNSNTSNSKGPGQAKAVVFFVLVAIISIAQLVATRKKEVDQ